MLPGPTPPSYFKLLHVHAFAGPILQQPFSTRNPRDTKLPQLDVQQ